MDEFCEVIISSLMIAACILVIWYMPRIASVLEWIKNFLAK